MGKAIMAINSTLYHICSGRELKECVQGKIWFCCIANTSEILDRIQLGKLELNEHNSWRVRLPTKAPKSIGTRLKMESHGIILTAL